MDLAPNRMLGHYRLVEKIGEGGMGVVWKGLDTTLNREVAIKVLPDLFASDPDRLARFEREAKVLASLNHPGIATIHGLHHAEGVHFLAMELAPGTDLAHRLSAGPLPIDETLGIALKVAEALEAAHDSGVVHRDLKPANIQIAPDGKVKVLDFGLAKALEGDPTGSGAASMSPTLTTPAATRVGVILGTAAYMSPEQAKGKPVDRRADIWAFGCLLYEMLAGRRPFTGDGVSEVLAAVIMAPVEIGALPPSVPQRIRSLVRRCLEKDPRRRLRDIGEARLALEETLTGAAEETAATPASEPRPQARRTIALVAAAAAIAVAATYGLLRFTASAPQERTVRRFELPSHSSFRSGINGRLVGISPDGQAVAYVEDGKIHIRTLARLEPTVIPVAAEPLAIFWSPDSAFLGYIATAKLWKVPASGGESSLIADLPGPGLFSGGCGASWGRNGKIAVTRGEGGLYQVSALGGDVQEILKIDEAKETDFHQPSWLPDGSGVIFATHKQGGRPDTLVLFAGGKRKDLLTIEGQDIWFPLYSPTGHILYRRQPSNAGIWALPFSLARNEVTGEPFLIVANGDVPSVSDDGTLVYVRGAASRMTQLEWVDRSGKALGQVGPPQEQWPCPELSPDGRYVAVAAKENEVSDIWIHDTTRGTRTRLSAQAATVTPAAWSKDGSRLVYAEGTNIPFKLMMKSADGGGDATEIGFGWGASFSQDGRYLLYADSNRQSNFDLFYIDFQGDGKPIPLLRSATNEIWPRLSPDGRYFVYVSDESGPEEVYIKRFPGGEGKVQVSTGGGTWPRWNRRGDHLYYVQELTLMQVDVATQPDLRLSAPRPLFTRQPLGWNLIFGWPPGFDVSPRDDRFLISQALEDKGEENGIIVLENWLREFAHP